MRQNFLSNFLLQPARGHTNSECLCLSFVCESREPLEKEIKSQCAHLKLILNKLLDFCIEERKITIFAYLNKHIFGLEFIIFCWDLKENVVISQKSTSNNSYTLITWNLTVSLNPQGKLQQESQKQKAQNTLLFL